MFKTTSTTTTYFYDEEGKLTDKMVTRSFHTGEDDEDTEKEQEQQEACCHEDDYEDNEDHLFDEMLKFGFEPEVELKVERNFGLTDILRIVSGCIWAANIVMALRALRRMKGRD